MIRVWKWLHQFSEKKYKEAHLNKYHSDIKCPNCEEWFSISGIKHNHEAVSKPDWGFHVKCGLCKHESYWNAVAAPVLLIAKPNGDPL
jgi:hypothetical protein